MIARNKRCIGLHLGEEDGATVFDGALQTVGFPAPFASSIVVIRALDPTPTAAQAVPGVVVAPIGRLG